LLTRAVLPSFQNRDRKGAEIVDTGMKGAEK
jgi:hypothetical protein